MNALMRRSPWPSFAYLLLLAAGALLREQDANAADAPTAAAAATATAATATAATTAPSRREIAYGAHPRQRFDVYAPARTAGAPTVFFVHGGGWRRGDKGLGIGAKAARWTAAGAFVVSTNYRLVPDADPLEQARDVARALAEAQKQVARLGGDPDRFVLMGHSAGGHLVALLAAAPALAREAGARPWRGSVLLDAGTVDVVARLEGGAPALFENAFGDDPAFWRTVSPMHRLEAKTAPILAVCAAARRDACADNRAFVEKARRFGSRAELQPEPLSHMRINRDLGEDNAYTREVEAFLRSVGLTLGR